MDILKRRADIDQFLDSSIDSFGVAVCSRETETLQLSWNVKYGFPALGAPFQE